MAIPDEAHHVIVDVIMPVGFQRSRLAVFTEHHAGDELLGVVTGGCVSLPVQGFSNVDEVFALDELALGQMEEGFVHSSPQACRPLAVVSGFELPLSLGYQF